MCYIRKRGETFFFYIFLSQKYGKFPVLVLKSFVTFAHFFPTAFLSFLFFLDSTFFPYPLLPPSNMKRTRRQNALERKRKKRKEIELFSWARSDF